MSEILTAVMVISILAVVWYLFYRFVSPLIYVEINNDSIIFTTDKFQISLKAYIFISNVKKRYRLLSVGEEPNTNEPSTKIDLFQNDGGEKTKEYLECLEAFFRHGFSKVTGRRALVAPKVKIKGAEKIYMKVNGVTLKSFYKVMKHAGAIQCDLEQ